MRENLSRALPVVGGDSALTPGGIDRYERSGASLEAAGFILEHAYGDWFCGPVTETGIEHILIARRD